MENTGPLQASPLRDANDIATIIYTSGTTGAPKGAMHRFAAFVYFALSVTRVVGDTTDDRMVSYLPLAHIAERALSEANAIHSGMHMLFVERLDTLLDDLRRARPTILFSVPRVLIKFKNGVEAKIPQARLDRLLRMPVVSAVVKRRILRQLGLDHIRVAASGGRGAALERARLVPRNRPQPGRRLWHDRNRHHPHPAKRPEPSRVRG